MKAYWLGLLYALLSASVSYVTANGLGPNPPAKESRSLNKSDYENWYNRDRLSEVLTLNRTAGNQASEMRGVQTVPGAK